MSASPDQRPGSNRVITSQDHDANVTGMRRLRNVLIAVLLCPCLFAATAYGADSSADQENAARAGESGPMPPPPPGPYRFVQRAGPMAIAPLPVPESVPMNLPPAVPWQAPPQDSPPAPGYAPHQWGPPDANRNTNTMPPAGTARMGREQNAPGREFPPGYAPRPWGPPAAQAGPPMPPQFAAPQGTPPRAYGPPPPVYGQQPWMGPQRGWGPPPPDYGPPRWNGPLPGNGYGPPWREGAAKPMSSGRESTVARSSDDGEAGIAVMAR